MQKKVLLLLILLMPYTKAAWGAFTTGSPQDDYERSIEAVVRHKTYYKSGKVELGPTVGITPYNSIINNYFFGGRLNWHLSDHYGWEVIDAQISASTITSYTTNLVSTYGISNLQTLQINGLIGTNFLLSPIYGKIRLWGHGVLFFDTYIVVGGGLVNDSTVQVSTASTGAATTTTSLTSGFDPMFDFGLGFKLFLNHAMALNFDLRDYVVSSVIYGNRTLTSNYTVSVGLSFFLPTF